jgi:hypothetical protein
MALTAKKKLDVLAKAVALRDLFRTECASDTGQWRGRDTGSASRHQSRSLCEARSDIERKYAVRGGRLVHQHQGDPCEFW